MSEDSGSSRRGPFPALPAVALMLIVSAVVLQVPALKSSRPLHDPLPKLGKVSGRQVRARLWQDPLQAVYAENEKRKEERRKGDLAEIKGELSAISGNFDMSASPGEKQPDWRLNLKINRGLGDGPPKPGLGAASPAGVNAREAGVPSVRGTISAVETPEEIEVAVAEAMVTVGPAASQATQRAIVKELGWRRLFLPVLLQGGPYPEAAEMRMRTRYAVLSALGKAGYKPEHVKRLRYVSFRELLSLGLCDDGTVTPDSYKREFLIPFERWHNSDVVPGAGNYTPVYVVWIDEDALKDRENVVYDLDTEFAWRLSRTLAMFERWLSDDRRLEIIRKAAPRALSRIPESLPKNASPALRSAVQMQVGENIRDQVCRLQFEPAEYRVLGPVSSDSLLELRSTRAPHPPYLPDETPLPTLEFYCSRATVANQVLEVIERTRFKPSNPRLESENQVGFLDDNVSKFITIFRTTATDDRLIGSLLKELRIRDASPARTPTSEEKAKNIDRSEYFNAKNHMVFIGEWDTLYGRARRCTLLNEIIEPQRDKKYVCSEISPSDEPDETLIYNIVRDNLHFISYMRGLDGRIPNENKTEGFHPRDPKTNEVELPGELPVGPAQLDYLRRLQKKLRKIQRDLTEIGRGELKAIGVIGSDVYDKLLILKALRPHFPRAVFFTTDLDAQMVHPSENEHARNLIVASPYGLTLHPDLQRGIPPFRDSYQTATYLSTLYAIGDTKAEQRMGKPINLPAPRIFEIGRSSAHDLTILDNVSDPQDNSDPRATSVHPDSDVHRPLALVNFHPVWAAITFFLGLFLLCPLILTIMQDESKWYSSQKAEPFRKFLKTSWAFVLLFLVVVLGAVYVLRPWEWVWAWYDNLLAKLFREWKNHELEPLVMFQGISAWPTEFLRMIAFSLSLWFVLKIYLRLETSAESLELKQRPSSSEPKSDEAKIDKEDANPLVYDKAWKERNWHQTLRMEWKNDQVPVAIGNLWNEYRYFGKLRWRAARACFWALVYFLFGSALFVLLGYPAEPLRGKAIVTIDNVAFYTSVVALLILVFWVLDASRLCDGFVRQISRENVFWRLNQESAKDKTGESRGDRRGNLEKTRLIAALTNAVGQCLWYPFLVLFLLIMSRNSVFDNWDWPLALVSLCVFLVAATLLSGWLPRRSARFARRSALQLVNAERDKLSRSSVGSGKADPRLAYLDHVIDEINAIRTGAFSSVGESPILGAPLIPVVLYGLMELLATLGH